MRIDETGAHEAAKGSTESGKDRVVAESRKTILLIEDSEADRDLYGSLLWYNGYEVIHAADGESGLSRALASRPDLILLDLRLPGDLSGMDVMKRLREEGVDAPVVALTAISRDELGADAAGFLTYLEKPIPPVDVVREVQRRVGFAL